jgi:hypothetical protein
MKRLAGLVLFLVIFAGAAIVRARQDSVIPYPDEQVSAALDRLAAPSVPGPLPGDPAIAVGWYGHAGTCDDARAAYQAAGAPLPPGASTTLDAGGNVQVDAPYGPAGVVFGETADGGCNYAVEVAPTLVVSGAGVRETTSFSSVMCTTFLGIAVTGADFETADGPFYFFGSVGDTPDTWQLEVVGGRLADGISGNATPGASTDSTVWNSAVATTANGYVFDGDGPQGPLHVELTCTPFKAAA